MGRECIILLIFRNFRKIMTTLVVIPLCVWTLLALGILGPAAAVPNLGISKMTMLGCSLLRILLMMVVDWYLDLGLAPWPTLKADDGPKDRLLHHRSFMDCPVMAIRICSSDFRVGLEACLDLLIFRLQAKYLVMIPRRNLFPLLMRAQLRQRNQEGTCQHFSWLQEGKLNNNSLRYFLSNRIIPTQPVTLLAVNFPSLQERQL